MSTVFIWMTKLGNNNEFKTMHLFAGAGGGLLADLILGHKPVIAVEWDKYACSVLRARANDGWFPDLSVWEGDVRMYDPSKYAGKVDCIHAGFPCQDISVAGKQAGVGQETRSGLYREIFRIADVVRPKELYLENVSAIISNGMGVVLADLSALGYSARWICLRASDVGANHGRDRWWLLARKVGNSEKFKRDGFNNNTRNSEQSSEIPEFRNTSRTENVAYTESFYAQGLYNRSREMQPRGKSWWEVEPNVDRVANELASRVDRLKSIGNGQVPLQAAVAYSILAEMFT
jgi:DNA (cytosine-5)-methyltransferase 1